MNGQGSLYVDRGQWLYRFTLDSGSIAISRARRAGQYLVVPDVWRRVAELGVTDALIVSVNGSWQVFLELAEGRHRWALAPRGTLEEAEECARYVLMTLADSIAGNPRFQGPEGTPASMAKLPGLPGTPTEGQDVEEALAQARSQREADGWELVYNRPRASPQPTS